MTLPSARTRRRPMEASDAPPSGRPFVSIVVPCRNEAEYIGPLLDSILANDYPHDRLEVLVVAGMSADGTREAVAPYAERHPSIRLLDNPRRITPCALNLGISQAGGAIIFRMDAHDRYPMNYIGDLVAWLERTGADHVGGVRVTLPADGTAVARAIALALAHPFAVGSPGYRRGTPEPREEGTAPLGCYRREVFARVGLFDEELVRNQDAEFDFRLRKAGQRMLVSLLQLARMYYQYGYFHPLVARKAGRITTRRQLVPPLFVTGLITTGLLAPWFAAARVAWALVLGAYATATVACSTVVLLRHGVRVGLVIPAAFAVVHVSYGLGFLRGVWDFLVLRRPAPVSVPLSR